MEKKNNETMESNCELNDSELEDVSGGENTNGYWDTVWVCPNCRSFRYEDESNINMTIYKCMDCGTVIQKPKRKWEDFFI